MKIKNIFKIASMSLSAVMAFSSFASGSFAALPYELDTPNTTPCWYSDPASTSGAAYWYEDGVRQGTYSDPKGVIGDNTVRGREIFDPASNGWYWLDACYDGAKAVNKEVWMPYIYQDEASWSEDKKKEVAAESDFGMDGLGACVLDAINKKAGKWVRYNKEGKMVKGWYSIAAGTPEALLYPDQVGNTYYYDERTGLMAKGEVTIDGEKCVFDKISGALISRANGMYGKDTVIMEAPGKYALEGDVTLGGSGNGYMTKFVVTAGSDCALSWGIQYDVRSGSEAARSKCALFVENVKPSIGLFDYHPAQLIDPIVGETEASVHLMLSINTETGYAFCFCNGVLADQVYNPGLVGADDRIWLRADIAVQDYSTVYTSFKNVKMKCPYYGKIRVVDSGILWYEDYTSPDGLLVTRAFADETATGRMKDAYGVTYADGYYCSYMNGVNNSAQDWDVYSGAGTSMYYLKGDDFSPFADGYRDYLIK